MQMTFWDVLNHEHVKRKCQICKELKPLIEFGNSRNQPFGKSYYCIQCRRIDGPRKNASTEERKKELRRKAARRHRENNPHKAMARLAVTNAIICKKLVPAKEKACVECGLQAEAYHHHSYKEEYWLDVIPLCNKCHRNVHKAGKEISN